MVTHQLYNLTLVSSDYITYHDWFIFHSLEHNGVSVPRICKFFCLRSLSRSVCSNGTVAVDGAVWCECVCGKGQRLAQPKTQKRVNSAGKGLLAGLVLGWHLGTWISGGFPPFQELERERAKLCKQCGLCRALAFPPGVWAGACARQRVPMWPAPSKTLGH